MTCRRGGIVDYSHSNWQLNDHRACLNSFQPIFYSIGKYVDLPIDLVNHFDLQIFVTFDLLLLKTVHLNLIIKALFLSTYLPFHATFNQFDFDAPLAK